ncbi:MAG TPA: hypothetical protein VHV83_02990, partial [Armatimonadota bacterium]|nr:hypothetical protein [Armatimonadota bacterium]
MSQSVLALPKVDAPTLDEPFLSAAVWQNIPAVDLVRADTGEPSSLPTHLHAAWSQQGIHLRFTCVDSMPLGRDYLNETPIEGEDMVGVFLDPTGERNEYMALFVTPYGQIIDSRVENPLHNALHLETDASWDYTGVRVRTASTQHDWTVEIFLPFNGITPALPSPTPDDRWVANF